MTVANMLSCPHCQASNPVGSDFCGSCGKALPSAVPSTPRIVADYATTGAGQSLQLDELHKQSRKAANWLLVVAVIQIAIGALLFVVSKNMQGGNALIDMGAMSIAAMIVGVLFLGLFFWARKQPLPAAIVGLVLYVTLSILDYVVLFMSISEAREQGLLPPAGSGNTSSPTPGLGIPWMKIIIIGMLVQAIQAGIKHRRLKKEIERQAMPVAPLPQAV